MQFADDWLGPPSTLNAITSATRALEVMSTIRASSISLPHDRKHLLVEVVESLDSCQCYLRTMSSDRRALVEKNKASGGPSLKNRFGEKLGVELGFDLGFELGFDLGFDLGLDHGFDLGFDPGFDLGFDLRFDVANV